MCVYIYYNFNLMEDFMKSLYIYEKIDCCMSGACGCDSYEELARVGDIVDHLNNIGASITRYSLDGDRAKFDENKIVGRLLAENGENVLPIVIVNNELLISRRYPTNEEFYDIFFPASDLDDMDDFADDGCGCGGSCSC